MLYSKASVCCCIMCHVSIAYQLTFTAAAGNICFPTDDVSLSAIAAEFAKVTPAVPNVVAAVDGVLFETGPPPITEHSAIGGHYCRKGYFAVSVLTFVDAHMRILSLSMSVQSSSHDSACFGASGLGSKVRAVACPWWIQA